MFFIVLGTLLASIGLEVFLIPNDIIDGGIVGISIISSYLTSVPLGLYLFLFNLPFVLIGYKQIGKTFAFSTLFAITTLSVFVTIIHHVHIETITNDVWLATVFGGIIIGNVVTRLEISKLKEIVNEVDHEALVTIGSVELIGKKYAKKAIH